MEYKREIGGRGGFFKVIFRIRIEELGDFSLLSHERNRSEGNLSVRADWRSRLWR